MGRIQDHRKKNTSSGKISESYCLIILQTLYFENYVLVFYSFCSILWPGIQLGSILWMVFYQSGILKVVFFQADPGEEVVHISPDLLARVAVKLDTLCVEDPMLCSI